MVHRILWGVLAGTVCAAAGVISAPAADTGCCFAVRPAAPPPMPYAMVVARPQMYVVNQGPVYSGPNMFTVPRYQENVATFTPYPYAVSYAPFVGRDAHPPAMRYRPLRPPHPPLRAYRPLRPRMGPYFPPSREFAPPPRFGHVPPPLQRSPAPPHVAPPHGPAPEAAPPLPRPRPEPKKPVEEQWTRGVPK